METTEKKPTNWKLVAFVGLFLAGVFLGYRAAMSYVRYKLNSDSAFDFIRSFFPPSATSETDEKDTQA